MGLTVYGAYILKGNTLECFGRNDLDLPGTDFKAG